MERRRKLLICAAAAAHMLLSMMAVIILFRIRKRDQMATKDTEDEDEGDVSAVPDTSDDDKSSSSVTGPNKRPRLDENEDTDQRLVQAFESACDRLAEAIEKCAAAGNMDLPPDLFEKVQELPGFDDTHKSRYYAYLVENPHMGRAFYNVPLSYRLSFITKWISEVSWMKVFSLWDVAVLTFVPTFVPTCHYPTG